MRDECLLIPISAMRGKKYTLSDPWEHAIAGWTDWMLAANRSKTTIHTRRGVVRYIALQLGGDGPWTVTGAALLRLAAKAEWGADYRRSVRTSLIQFFDWCVANQICDTNPAAELPPVPESKPRPRPVTDEAWQHLLATADPRARMMGRLAAEAGLRRAEVAGLKRQDLIEEPDGWTLIVRGKGNKQRLVPITDSLASAIHTYSSGWSPKGYIFPGNDNGHISPNWAGKIISDLLPPGWTMHKLRHRYASRGYAATRDLRAVQEALGHASVATTQRYTAVTRSEVRAVSEAAA